MTENPSQVIVVGGSGGIGCVAALHPGTNDTALSKPFQANVKPEDLFEPAYTAGKFLQLITQLSPGVSGKFWAWDGEILPW